MLNPRSGRNSIWDGRDPGDEDPDRSPDHEPHLSARDAKGRSTRRARMRRSVPWWELQMASAPTAPDHQEEEGHPDFEPIPATAHPGTLAEAEVLSNAVPRDIDRQVSVSRPEDVTFDATLYMSSQRRHGLSSSTG
jgi:hypothetical protein